MTARRAVLLALPILLMLGLPLVLAALAVARLVLLPPAPHTQLIGFDGLQADGFCAGGAAAPGQARPTACRWSAHLDSRFEILHHDPAAAALCRALQAHYYDPRWLNVRLGGLRVGVLAPVNSWWAGCSDMIPLEYGVYVDLQFDH